MNKELFIFEPHNMLITGVTNCGKTHFILGLLETIYENHFENIVLFCPTYDFNITYKREYCKHMFFAGNCFFLQVGKNTINYVFFILYFNNMHHLYLLYLTPTSS